MNSGPGRDSNLVSAESGTISPVAVAHVELADILGPGPVVAFRLDVDLPLAAEAVEVVYEQPAHERLDGSIDIVQRHSLLEDFVSVDIHELLRHAGQERCSPGRRSRDALRAAAMNVS